MVGRGEVLFSQKKKKKKNNNNTHKIHKSPFLGTKYLFIIMNI